MNETPFEVWRDRYVRWRADCAALLGIRLPGEVQALLDEQQRLEPLRWEAQGYRADAVAYYYRAKLRHIEDLQSKGMANTALHDVAKAKCYKELWTREDSLGVYESVISRSFKVSQELKRQGVI